MTPRERELLEETEFTGPVEFHSFRRAFKQALGEAGVEPHTRWRSRVQRTRRRTSAPHEHGEAAADPRCCPPPFSIDHAETPEPENDILRGRDRFRTCDIRLVRPALRVLQRPPGSHN